MYFHHKYVFRIIIELILITVINIQYTCRIIRTVVILEQTLVVSIDIKLEVKVNGNPLSLRFNNYLLHIVPPVTNE